MGTVQKRHESGILLSDAELRFLMPGREKYEPKIFGIIRAEELEGYRPARREAGKLYSELSIELGGSDFAARVLGHYARAERSCKILEGAEEDRVFLQASEVLRGMSRAPLIAELEFETAYTLWRRAGSWPGAMMLAGLESLEPCEKVCAIKRYAISAASPDLLPRSVKNKLTPKCYDVLREICGNVRVRGDYPTSEELSRARSVLHGVGLKASKVLDSIGIAPAALQKKSTADDWKARSHWWRSSEKYKKLQSAVSFERSKKGGQHSG